MNKKVKCLIYCTKAKPYLVYDYYDKVCGKSITANEIESWHLNGKIVCQFDCEDVEEINISSEKRFGEETKYYIYSSKEDENLEYYYREDYIEKETCLKCSEISNYLNKGKGYAIHISNLEIFDEPKELSDYYLFEPNNCILKEIKKAPQSMCRVIERNRLIYVPSEEYILISIRPEWVCKILNGEKTIEVRKKILNCLKELI